jgi:3-hydroxy-9,10-secoandrosta-1,3,5(10)-triene-9,17-dione monooxygenase reductase component
MSALTTAGPDTDTFRDVMGRFVTGVAVITAEADEGHVGLTANSLTSVSLDPPRVLFCVGHRSRTGEQIRAAGAFAVNILAHEQQPVCRRFAGPCEHRFRGDATITRATGAPVLDEALAYVDCRIVDVFDGGDHAIVLGEVAEAGVLRDAEPLTFFRGSYTPPARGERSDAR